MRNFEAICQRASYRNSPKRKYGASIHTKPRAIKQLSNDELFKIVQISKDNQNCDEHGSSKDRAGNTAPVTQDSGPPQKAFPSALQQSPLTAESLTSSRARFKEQKPSPGRERSPFQLKLQKNPYGKEDDPSSYTCTNSRAIAHALSTPPRLCVLTGVRLPSFYQISFGIAKHPVTGAPWHLPKLSDFVAKTDGGHSSTDPASAQLESDDDHGTDSHSGIRTLTGTHFMKSRQALSHISKLPRSAYHRLHPFRWKEDSSLKTSEIVWREDMDTFVLERIRKSITNELIYLASRPAAYIAPCKEPHSIAKHGQIGAVLYLGNALPSHSHHESANTSESAAEQGPPEYAMHHYRSQYIPYYNMLSLLGPTNICTLRQRGSNRFDGQIAALKAKNMTRNVQLALWSLLGYLAS